MLVKEVLFEAYPSIAIRSRATAQQPTPIPKPDVNLMALTQIPGAAPVIRAAELAGIKGIELAQFVAQLKHESWNFTRLQEVPKGAKYFRRYDIKHNPKQARSLGNRHQGDGARYRGRGYIQLTGRENYQRAGKALGIDLVRQPELAARPDIAARVAVWYWTSRVRPYVRDWMDTAQVTRLINPGLMGLQDRQRNFQELLK